MLGFSIHGAEIRHDVPLTLFSAVTAMAVVGPRGGHALHRHGGDARPPRAPRHRPAAGRAGTATPRPAPVSGCRRGPHPRGADRRRRSARRRSAPAH
ncbi:hypothetical protein ACFYTF_26425 [Nocardia thailandica]|uniref:Uncharacterized protein n=1 Tax=Nocardia thailandica TaxID=257275 RepID=A0ABW6PW34_9NOCA